MNTNNKNSAWRLKIHEKVLNEVLSRYKHNRPFIVNLSLMFDYLARASMLLWNRKSAVHILMNQNKAYHEIHYRFIPISIYEDDDNVVSTYDRYEKADNTSIDNLISIFHLGCRQDTKQMAVVKLTDKYLDEFMNNPHLEAIGISKDVCKVSAPIVINLDVCGANLGSIILFGNEKSEQNAKPFDVDASSCNTVVSWCHTIAKFLSQQAGIVNDTYLPSYKVAKSAKAAIIFADIRNFTQLATMLRILQSTNGANKASQLGDILRSHCSDMSRIVNKCRGRVERFVGDGLMAVFGEHEEDASIAVANAVAAAQEMVLNFRSRRHKIYDILYGNVGQNELNEMVELDLGVGINYGTVLFEYLGDEIHQEYSCIGDHVAFAERLMQTAAKYDSDLGTKWPPILLSQTVEKHIRYWFDCNQWTKFADDSKHILHAKGYGYPSYVFAFETDFFDLNNYYNLIKDVWLHQQTESAFVQTLKNKHGYE
jgi:class 3 adenylate cyclase